METRHFIVGTAGHIDHGKSTLVEALSGTNPDRLPEEQKRGMTIDLGFAHLPLQSDSGPVSLGLIDVPGHADFVKNMVAGVGAIDVALLVVACDDSWMPQTEEHVQILDYLGVENGIIALTKSDLATDLDLVKADVAERIAGTFFADAPMIPVCALGGEGLEEIQQALLQMVDQITTARDFGKARLAVDRVFSPKGVGTVVTGTLSGGALHSGDEVVVAPSGQRATIRGIQSHLKSNDTAYPGMRTALNIPDLGAGRESGKKSIARGDTVLGGEAELSASSTFDVLLRKHDRVVDGQPRSLQQLKDERKVRVHLGSSSHEARVFLIQGKTLERGSESIAQLRFTEPAYAIPGDTFVLRDWGQHGTVAGGVVLDPDATRRHFHSEERKDRLLGLATGLDDPATYLEASLATRPFVREEDLLRSSPFGEDAVREAIEGHPDLISENGWVLARAPWASVVATAQEKTEGYHSDHPNEVGIPIASLRETLAMPSQEIFDQLLVHLETKHEFSRSKGLFRSPSHQLKLPKQLVAAGDRIRKALDSPNPYEPPGVAELIQSTDDDEALQFLIDTGEVIKLDPKAILLASAYESARDQVVAHLEAEKKATASDIRQLLGTTRRILIPLLERLDSAGITQRIEEFRVLRRR